GLELEDLERAIDALPEDMREAVLLVGLEGLSYNDAAVSLGIKTGTLKSRLSRSRDLLRRIFEGHADRSAETPPPPGQARLKPRGTARPSLRALPVAPQVLRKALGIRRSLSD
ncbi:MAG TPA: sigma factor-like helix-turn-helix DNA-binding protein, partial [Alphaproteobacteria bacterium]|nr:sigma factor-like helix-turn-helix DNA-binding protein [Alphaproteobacteria bacterium]